MYKYITDTIKNNLKSILRDCTKPESKAVTEVARGLLGDNDPIMRHLAQNAEVSAKKQGEKYSYHLEKVDLMERVEKVALRHALSELKKYTIIAYDLSDIAKESAKKMEKLRRVFDGSKRKPTNGYTFHGVGINHMLVKTELHDGDKDFLPQIRKRIVSDISEILKRNGKNQGVWVFDRGNDDKQFFHFLRSELKVHFIVRLKENRQVVIKKTGVVIRVRDLKEGQYDVLLFNRMNTKVIKEYSYRLVIHNHLDEKQPIRLLTTLSKKRFSKRQIVTMYLQRWGIENSFKRIKQKFGLEKIRVLKYQTFENLIALTLFSLLISTVIYQRIQQMNHQLIAGVLMLYKKFLKQWSLKFNLDSFITFLQKTIPPLINRNHSPPNQPSLFSHYLLEKLGSI